MTPDPRQELLESLGLTRYEAAAYLTLLRREVFTLGELSLVAEIPRQRIPDVVDSLEKKGLCQVRSARPRLVAATEPELALAALGEKRKKSLSEEEQRLEERTAELGQQLRLLRRQGPPPTTPLQYLGTYRSPTQMAAVAQALAATATDEMCASLAGPLPLAPAASLSLFAEELGRGVSVRVLCDSSADPTRELGKLMRDYYLKGLEVRRLEGESVPLRLLVVREGGVLIFLRDPLAGEVSYSATLIRHPDMTLAMGLLFDTLWQRPRARPLDAYGHPRA